MAKKKNCRILIDPSSDGTILRSEDFQRNASVNVSPCGRIAITYLEANNERMQKFVIFDLLFGHRKKFLFGPSMEIIDYLAISPTHVVLFHFVERDHKTERRLSVAKLNYESDRMDLLSHKIVDEHGYQRIAYANGQIVLSSIVGALEFQVLDAATLNLVASFGSSPDPQTPFANIRNRIDVGLISLWMWNEDGRQMTTVRTERRPNSKIVVRGVQTLNVDSGNAATLIDGEKFGELMDNNYPSIETPKFADSNGNLICHYPNMQTNVDRIIVFDFPKDEHRRIDVEIIEKGAEWKRVGIQSGTQGSIFLLFGDQNLRIVHLDLTTLTVLHDEIGDRTPLIPDAERWLFEPAPSFDAVISTPIAADPMGAIRLHQRLGTQTSISPDGRVLFTSELGTDRVGLMAIDLLFGTGIILDTGLMARELAAISCDEIAAWSIDDTLFRCTVNHVHNNLNVERRHSIPNTRTLKFANNGQYAVTSREYPVTDRRDLTLIRTHDMQSLTVALSRTPWNAEYRVLDDWTQLRIVECPIQPKHQLEVDQLNMITGERQSLCVIMRGALPPTLRGGHGGECMFFHAWSGSRLFISHTEEPSTQKPTELIQWVDVRDLSEGWLKLKVAESDPPWQLKCLQSANDGGFFAVFGDRRPRCLRIPVNTPTSLQQICQLSISNGNLQGMPPNPPIRPLFSDE